jgi:hypothetical protein
MQDEPEQPAADHLAGGARDEANDMNRLRRHLFLKYANWRISPGVVAWRRKLDQKHLTHQARHGYWLEHLVFFAVHRYWPDFRRPRSFNEKVCAKKLYDRNPVLPVLADKHRARDFVRERLGPDGETILIPQLCSTDDPDTIDFDALDGDYVIKANHGCSMMAFHRAGEPIDEELLRARMKLWMVQDYGVWLNEWGYYDIPRRIVIERFLQDSEGNPPSDLRIFCFSGVCKMIRVTYGYLGTYQLADFDRNLNRLDVRQGHSEVGDREFPENIHEMIAIAERLSAGFDLLRVDLYSVNGKIYLGELTNYPRSGLSRIRPRKMDWDLGQLWSETQAFLPD